MIRMGGTKMSKSKGNLVRPQEYFDTVGADALRLFHLFVGPPAGRRGLGRPRHRGHVAVPAPAVAAGRARRATPSPRRTARRGSRDRSRHAPPDRACDRRVRPLVVQHRGRVVHGVRQPALQAGLDAVRGRHVAAAAGADGAAHHRRAVGAAPSGRARPRAAVARRPTPRWPRSTRSTMVVQVNGKVRDRVEVAAGIDAAEVERLALASTEGAGALDGARPGRSSPGRRSLVNVVV